MNVAIYASPASGGSPTQLSTSKPIGQCFRTASTLTGETTRPGHACRAFAACSRSRRRRTAAGDRAELVTIEGAGHLDLWNPESAAFDRVVEAATTFFSTLSS